MEPVINKFRGFRKICSGIGFTPHTESIIFESFRIASIFGAELHFVSIGDFGDTEKKQIEGFINIHKHEDVVYKLTFIPKIDIVIELLDYCNSKDIDLLIVGAPTKESYFKYYLGSISRNICRRSNRTVLLLADPSSNVKEIKSIVVNGNENPKTSFTLACAAYVAKCAKSKEIHVIHENQLHALQTYANTHYNKETLLELFNNSIVENELEKVKDFISTLDSGFEIITKSLIGKPGFIIANYARQINAGMLIINSSDSKLGVLDRLFPHDLELVLEDLPCNLMIVHSNN